MSIDTNLIYRGDCRTVLKRHFPENCIDLMYVDPPFSFDPKYARLWYDKETLEMFEEIRKGGVKHYTSWMSKRLEQCHRVLKDTGSMYLHCDWKFGHYLKVEMDNIFGRNNFQNEFVWLYSGRETSKRRWNRKHDTIFFYTKGEEWTFNYGDVLEPLKETSKKALSRHVDKAGRKFILRYKRGGGFAPLSEEGPKTYRQYVPEGIPPRDWAFIDYERKSKRVGYATQKPKHLLERIIKASSNPDDIVLDPMCGCGTTIAVAHNLNRKWIGIDISTKACEVMKERMKESEGIIEVEVRGLPLTTNDLKRLKAFEFEDYICDMTNSIKTQHVADKGIDGYHSGETPLQIKQQERVGRNTVDNFETAVRRRDRNRGCIIAFSFTKNAYEEVARARAKDKDRLDIKLVEVDKLIKVDYDLKALLE